MSAELLKNTLLVWVGLFVLAFANGAAREIGIKRWVREPWAHHLSALTAIVIFSAYVSLVWREMGILTARQAFYAGMVWFILTALTETFALNRWMSKLSWKEILQSYNLARGQLWLLVLLWIGLLPWIMLKVRGPAG